ncbi:MAG: aspartate aminotransferase family protein [Planctomycetes bacterium]|nr:aspartate aminotransferase family protein [Planctomycetota bacterium]MCB9910215.1 aspartate aminotransferase family protein [Planctomycetota bacterium]HPF13716.1 aspartate aminotransferase family protein [Planctomycetota bacterium]HRV80954.1 aspartate aminotransferase family protein [Planctomycetota bacterium]
MPAALTNSNDLLERRKNIVPRGVGVFNTATVATASGARIVDVDGNEWIDLAGGIGVVNAGHCPAPVVQAIQEQAAKYLHTSFNVVTYEPYIALCEQLAEILPHGEATKVMLVSTGAEAVENAIKIARQSTRRQAVLCYTGAFHGRSMMAMTLTSKVDYKHDCGPFAPEVYRLPFPNYYRYHGELSIDAFVKDELKRLRESGRNVVAPDNLAAIIIEVVQGEGGFNVVPEAYLKGLREYCDEHGIVLIFDEVQSGFGRTGKWGAYEHFGVIPDISTWAKSLGSGLPIAAVMGKAHIMDAAAPGTIGGTYIGNPVACAAALATLKYMQEIDINALGVHVGNIVRKHFEAMQAKYTCVGDVRGLGAMMAMEFVHDGDPRRPDHDTCHSLVEACAKRGVILISAGTHKNIIRVLSPLVIEDEVLERALAIMDEELLRIIQNNAL